MRELIRRLTRIICRKPRAEILLSMRMEQEITATQHHCNMKYAVLYYLYAIGKNMKDVSTVLLFSLCFLYVILLLTLPINRMFAVRILSLLSDLCVNSFHLFLCVCICVFVTDILQSLTAVLLLLTIAEKHAHAHKQKKRSQITGIQ